jgi:hypothetical protein
VEEGALAASAGAQDGDELARTDRQAYINQGLDSATTLTVPSEDFGDVVELDGDCRALFDSILSLGPRFLFGRHPLPKGGRVPGFRMNPSATAVSADEMAERLEMSGARKRTNDKPEEIP